MFNDGEQRILDIDGQRWRMVFVDELEKKGRPILGRFDRNIRMIFISLDQPHHELVTTVVHETLHAMVTGPNVLRRDHETWIDRTSKAITSVLSQLNLNERISNGSYV